MYLNHLKTLCKSLLTQTQRSTRKPISNITSIEVYRYLNQIKYNSSHLINNTHSHL